MSRGWPTEPATTCSSVCTRAIGSAGSIEPTICRTVGIIDVGSSLRARRTTVIAPKGCCSIVR
jgi:hypothetical protein